LRLNALARTRLADGYWSGLLGRALVAFVINVAKPHTEYFVFPSIVFVEV